MTSPESTRSNGFLRPQLPHSHSMPHLPQLQLTTTDDQNDIIDITSPASIRSRKFTFSDEDLTDFNLRKAQRELDLEKLEEEDEGEKGEDKPSGSSYKHQHHRDSTDTLVEAALDKPEVEERHSGYQDHVAESAAMVHRMLSTRVGPNSNIPTGGGSVLSTLMKLEAQRKKEEERREQKERKRREKKVNLSDMTSYQLTYFHISISCLTNKKPQKNISYKNKKSKKRRSKKNYALPRFMKYLFTMELIL